MPDKIPVEDYIVATELACQKLPNNETTVLRSEMAGVLCNANPPRSNIPREERKALVDLKKEDSALILPADKGKATVIMVYVPTCIHLFPHARADTIQVLEHEHNLSKFDQLTISFLVP